MKYNFFFNFLKQTICAQRCGRMKLERMAIVEIILLNKVLPYIFCYSKGTKLERMYGIKEFERIDTKSRSSQLRT